MRSFKQQADRIVELISDKVHPATVEELLSLLQEAAEQYRRENPETSKRHIEVDIQDEYVDFRFWNPDLHCGESSSFVRGREHRDKAGDEWLLGWISRSIRRLAEDAKTVLWYEFETNAMLGSRQTWSDHVKEPRRYGLKRVGHGVYAVREDRISHYIKPPYRDQKRLSND